MARARRPAGSRLVRHPLLAHRACAACSRCPVAPWRPRFRSSSRGSFGPTRASWARGRNSARGHRRTPPLQSNRPQHPWTWLARRRRMAPHGTRGSCTSRVAPRPRRPIFRSIVFVVVRAALCTNLGTTNECCAVLVILRLGAERLKMIHPPVRPQDHAPQHLFMTAHHQLSGSVTACTDSSRLDMQGKYINRLRNRKFQTPRFACPLRLHPGGSAQN
jgi:hypothetical protein